MLSYYWAIAKSKRLQEIYSAAPQSIGENNHLGVSRDDSWIYFTLEKNEADIWLMSLDPR